MCTKLESLKLKGTTFSQSAMEKYPLPNLSNLRELVFIRIYMQFNLQARIVAQCNQLKRLLWKTSASYAIPDEPLVCTFKDFIVSGQLSKIESVLIDASQCAILGEVFSKLMDLTNYNLISGKLWDPRIAATIRDYLPNLTEVNVDLDIDEGGQLVLMLLISCPQLHTVVTSLIKASDMMVLYPQRWACNGLKRFSVFFELDEVPGVLYEESNQFIMKQLSALTELEILLLNGGRYYKSETPAEGVLSICLASGMDILAELNSLRGVALPGHQPWTKAEIDWVADHWRRLTQLAGINKFNLVAEQGLEEELIRRGIRSKLYGDDFDELYPPHLLTVFSFY
ncbi:hypothetical protein BGZ76_008046 [Entomortierella beljakovae]|nr:hypothetical protein BGZ76_008046 [Entomortierella beljakovae]